MSYFLRFFLPIFILISCTNSADSVTEQDAKDFLVEVQEKAVTDGPVYSSAYWIQSNFISYDSQKVAADFSKRGILESLEQARTAATFDNLVLEPADRRALNIIKNGIKIQISIKTLLYKFFDFNFSRNCL